MPLLDRLVTEELGPTIAAEDWKWIAVAVNFPYGHTTGLRAGRRTGRPDEGGACNGRFAQDRVCQARDRVSGADELPVEIDQRLGEIEAALAAFESRSLVFDTGDIASAGLFLSIHDEGELLVDRGYVRPEDEAVVVDAEA